ncbi:MAG TPA: diacylglycerol kinase family protein [Jatrophihabitans sp.]
MGIGTLHRRVSALDRRLLRRATTREDPMVDVALRSVSRAANHSKLWVASAAALSVLGGSRGRRASLRGLIGIALTSAVVNGPLKLVLRRERPAAHVLGRPTLVAMPGSFSFPSGHAASAFAFATGVAREWPAAGVPIGAAAGIVAYSRVHNGVHYPTDVVVGAALGVGAAALAGAVLRGDPGIPLPPAEPTPVPRSAWVLASPSSGSAELYEQARQALEQSGIEVVRELDIADRAALADVVAMPAAQRPLVVAAGGDGTVGAAADELAGTGAVLAILPLGTSNDVARSLGIATDPVAAARAIRTGVVRAVDAGQVVVEGERARNFVHAATVGFNVHFAELAGASSLRRRFGRFTYAVAGVRALRRHRPFTCTLHYDGRSEQLELVQLSIVNAPVFGGALDLRVPGARLDDRSLVVIAVEQGSPVRLMLGALLTVVGRRRQGLGVRALRTKELRVHVDRPLDIALDGEIVARLPADFDVAADALRVVTPRLKNDRA